MSDGVYLTARVKPAAACVRRKMADRLPYPALFVRGKAPVFVQKVCVGLMCHWA